jgi:hypothetical protein
MTAAVVRFEWLRQRFSLPVDSCSFSKFAAHIFNAWPSLLGAPIRFPAESGGLKHE